MISFQTFKALAFTVAPLALPRLYSYYKSVRAQAHASPVPIRQCPPYVQQGLNVLFLSAMILLAWTLPKFSPESIFSTTSSRLQTPNDVLFTRLAALRPQGVLTELDEALRSRLASVDARCLYLAYGPSALANCRFCNSDDPMSFLYYTIPAILFPHILNLFALGIATSAAITGKEGSRWRTFAVLVGAVAALADLYMFYSYDWKINATATRGENLDHFFWTMRLVRAYGLALMDSLIAGLLWASSTNRLFVIPVSSAERLENVSRVLESTRGKLSAVGIVRNVTVRDQNLRKKGEEYWRREGEVMGEVMDEREVVEGVRSALESGRVSVLRIEDEARKYAESITLGQEGVVPG